MTESGLLVDLAKVAGCPAVGRQKSARALGVTSYHQ